MTTFPESLFFFDCSDIMMTSRLFLWSCMSKRIDHATVFEAVEKTVFAIAGSIRFLFSLPYQAEFSL